MHHLGFRLKVTDQASIMTPPVTATGVTAGTASALAFLLPEGLAAPFSLAAAAVPAAFLFGAMTVGVGGVWHCR